MNAIAPRFRNVISKGAALALLLGLLGVLYVGTAEPLLRHYADNEAAIRDAATMLERFKHAAQDRKVPNVPIGEIRADRSHLAHYFVAERLPLATAELQGQLKRVIDGAGGQLLSTQEIQANDKEPHQRVSVRVRMEATPSAMLQVFHALEASTPYLFLDNASIQPKVISLPGQRDNRDAQPEQQALVIQFDVFGYLWTEGT